MKQKYPKLIGNCKDCAGCNRLEDYNFVGRYRCPYYIPFKKRKGEKTNEQ